MNEQYMDFYTKGEINAMLDGLSFQKISQEDFDALTTKDANTIYYVYDDQGNITQYLGDAKMSTGTAATNAALSASGITGIAAVATNEEV